MTTDKNKKVPDDRPETDNFGMGADAEGRVQVLTPEEYERRKIERNAEEAVDGDAPGDED